ncbi:MAG: IS1182 family transposase [Chitinophagaceae bacterium]
MQGKEQYQEKLFNGFQLSERVPATNFYRRLKAALHLDFFKLCLVGYLENIPSDRKLIDHCTMRLDILFFLGYGIDEELPWHSTLSRTRQLFPTAVFEEVFTKVFALCVESGMVSGHTQVVDSAPVKANASMDSLELKVPEEDLEDHLRKVRALSARDKEAPIRKAKGDKAREDQRKVTANDQELQALKSRTKKWSKEQDQRPGAGNKGSRYTSNKTHYSPTDPDARISVKPGKARKLNYTAQLTVDTAAHVITDIGAHTADGKDNQHLPDIVRRVGGRLWNHGLLWENLLADTGYSSGENYALLEGKGITGYIPPHGTYTGGPEGFPYDEQADHYRCPQRKAIPFKKVFLDHRTRTKKREYRASKHICKGCPLKTACLGKAQEKRITVTYFRAEYERNNARVRSPYGRYLKSKRQATVEPVLGTLTQHMAMGKVYTIGLRQADKCMKLAATAYNLKKWLKFTVKRTKSGAGILPPFITAVQQAIRSVLKLDRQGTGQSEILVS